MKLFKSKKQTTIAPVANLTPEINTDLATATELDIKNKTRTKRIIFACVQTFFLLILSMMATRVPYVGSYLDATFEYLFGVCKFVMYFVLISVLLIFLFRAPFRNMFTNKKFITMFIFMTIVLCCTMSVIFHLPGSASIEISKTVNDFNTKWLTYLSFVTYDHFIHSEYLSGGFIGEIIVAVCSALVYIVLLIICIVTLAICVFIIVNFNYKNWTPILKLRGWVVRKLGGSFKYDINVDLKKQKSDAKIKKLSKDDVIKDAEENTKPSISLLPDSDVNFYDKNFKKATSIQSKINKYFKQYKINCVVQDLNIYTTFSEISFEAADSETIQSIIQNQKKISEVTKLDQFNISYRGNIIKFEIPNENLSKISFKTLMSDVREVRPYEAVLGFDEKNKSYIHSFSRNSSALIVGKKGSGAATFVVITVLSMCFSNDPKDLEVDFLSVNGDKTYSLFGTLPHCTVYEDTNKITDQLHNLIKEIDQRLNYLKASNAVSANDLNKNAGKELGFKRKLVVITNFDALTRDNFQNMSLISELAKQGNKVGIYLLLQANSINNETINSQIYDLISNKYILQLANDFESLKVFNNYRGVQLYGNGDCLMFLNNPDKKARIQIGYMNQNELVQDIELIKTFYETKNKQSKQEPDAKQQNYDDEKPQVANLKTMKLKESDLKKTKTKELNLDF